mmetsp:Transcript_6488/g.14019  ORF Transcript_6488/g.14019 Transcript_6488/m.14019 type:complete len:84 (-) Transcript_6488:177-428(-)
MSDRIKGIVLIQIHSISCDIQNLQLYITRYEGFMNVLLLIFGRMKLFENYIRYWKRSTYNWSTSIFAFILKLCSFDFFCPVIS